jgi:hypothetical protein
MLRPGNSVVPKIARVDLKKKITMVIGFTAPVKYCRFIPGCGLVVNDAASERLYAALTTSPR